MSKVSTTSPASRAARNRDVCVIMPVYNEATVVAKVIRALSQEFPVIVCVDDGSSDGSAAEIAKTDAILVRHPINLGQGGALQTGLQYARQYLPEATYFVTFDADGQHRLEDALAMLDVLRQGEYDVVLGSRFLRPGQELPGLKRVTLSLGVWFTNRLSTIQLTDTHNGLRAFHRRFADQCNLTMPDMAHASEIIDIIARSGLRWCEVPVTIAYTAYSQSKGQSVVNAVNIGFDVLARRFNGKTS